MAEAFDNFLTSLYYGGVEDFLQGSVEPYLTTEEVYEEWDYFCIQEDIISHDTFEAPPLTPEQINEAKDSYSDGFAKGSY